MGYQKIGDYLLANIVKEFKLNDEKIINIYEYIKRNEELQHKIYLFLIELLNSLPRYNKEQAIDYLLELYTDKREGSVVEYIVSTPQSELYSFFDANEYFRKDILECYIDSVKENNFHLKSEAIAEEIKKQEEQKKNESSIVNINTLPDLLRKSYMYAYKILTAHGMPNSLFGITMASIFKNNTLPETNDKELLYAFRLLLSYKEVFIRIMYGDIFMLTSMQNKDDKYSTVIDYINAHRENGNFQLPEETITASEFFLMMANINDDREIFREVIKNSSEEVLETYKEINPLSIIEDIDFKRS